MKNKISTVLYDKDLHTNFDANLIDNLKVKSIFNDDFLTCEYSGCNEEGENNQPYYDFGRISDFDFMIYSNKTRLFSGEGFMTGYKKSNPSNLQLFSVHNFNYETHYIENRNYSPELNIDKRPDTMFDFALMIDNYINLIIEDFTEIQIEQRRI